MDARNNPVGELNQFIYTQCYDQLCASVSAALGKRVSAVIHQNQIKISVDRSDVYYVFRAWAEYAPEEGDDLRLTCRVSFDSTSYSFGLLDITRMDMEHNPIPVPGVPVDQHLIPRLHDDERRETEAARFLARYCPEALTTPMAVPIRSIMEQKMGLTIVTDIQLIGETYGQILFQDNEELVMNDAGDDIWIVPYRRGTVLIDGEKAFMYGAGFGNFTLAHEAYHWFSHRAYVDFHHLIGAQEGSSYNGSSQYSSSDILEIQANAIASRILMPREMFLQKYREFSASGSVVASLASFFQVSFTAAALRLAQLGIADAQTLADTRVVSPDEAFKLYSAHEDFRELVDEGKLLFIDGAYVINDPKYVETVWEDVPAWFSTKDRCPYRLTEYALSHPDEAKVAFTVNHKRITAGDGVLLRESDDVLLAPVKYIRSHFPKEARRISRHSEQFEKQFAESKGKHQTFAEVARDMVNYRYGPMDAYNAVSSDGHDWNPSIQMSEVHEKYFEPTRLRTLEKLYKQGGDENEALWNAVNKETELEDSIEHRYRDNLVGREYDIHQHILEDSSSPVDLFCADTLQVHQYYTRIMNGKAKNPDPRTLMSLCVGLCLSASASRILFRSAGRVLTWDRENMAYRYILTHMRGDYIEDVNVFLDNLNLKPLGAQRQTKD